MKAEITLAEILWKNGYRAGLVGKWHCGRSRYPQPGFDYWLSFDHSKALTHRGAYDSYFYEQGRPVAYSGQMAGFFAEKAVEFMRGTPREKPFFLFAGFTDTHHPFVNHPERLVESYRSCRFSDIPAERPARPQGWVRRRCAVPGGINEQRKLLAQYYAAVSFIDEQVGRLLDELQGSGRLENTLVIYTADHGHMNGHHGLYFKGNATVPQNFYEEAIRVPCLLYWNGVIKAGKAHPEMVDHCDLFQTVLDAAGASPSGKLAKQIHSPGRSYLPLLRGKTMPRWAYAFLEYGNARMIRSARFKLLCRYRTAAGDFGDEFYDLERDPRERINRIGEVAYSGEITRLRRELERHFAEFENPGYSARRMDERPPCNPYEPWRMRSARDDFP